MNNSLPSTGLTGIIPFTYFGGLNKAVGSTVLRAENLAACMEDFEIWQHGHLYDNLIFQKVYWKEMLEVFNGPKILDLCDPDWLTGEVDIIEIGNMVDAITCSSKSLTELVHNYFPQKTVVHVPDRLNFDIFPSPRDLHKGIARKAVWFGFIHNAHETLCSMAEALIGHQFELTIISNQPYSVKDRLSELNPAFIEYDPSTIYHQLKQHDIVLNPTSAKAMFKYKSNNKSIISWKLGLPVAENIPDIERLISADARNDEVADKLKMVNTYYDIRLSAIQYREIIETIQRHLLVSKL